VIDGRHLHRRESRRTQIDALAGRGIQGLGAALLMPNSQMPSSV
jgi:hypothetical protein